MTKMSDSNAVTRGWPKGRGPHEIKAIRGLARLLNVFYTWQVFCILSLGLITGGGCLWAPNIHERSTENQPPELDFTKMEPNPDLVVVMTGPTIFSVTSAVTDPDDTLSDLRYWWFVDYRQNQGPAMFAGPGYSQIQLDPCLYPQLLDPNKEHTLEVVVVDPKGEVSYDVSQGRHIEHAAIGLWVIQSHAVCQ